jgi:hypothetical protein
MLDIAVKEWLVAGAVGVVLVGVIITHSAWKKRKRS